MSKQVVLLRVGIDAGCGGIQGPLFKDGTPPASQSPRERARYALPNEAL